MICPDFAHLSRKQTGAFTTGRKGINCRKGKGSTRPVIMKGQEGRENEAELPIGLSSGSKKSLLTRRLKKARKASRPKPDNSADQIQKTADQSQKSQMTRARKVN
jgi:hypothetical protein